MGSWVSTKKHISLGALEGPDMVGGHVFPRPKHRGEGRSKP